MTDPFIQHVARQLIDDADVLADEMCRRIIAEDPFYAHARALSYPVVRADVEQSLGQTLRGLAGLEPLDFGLTRDLAMRRADDGVPVAALLHAYRVCAQVIWDHHLAAGHSLGLATFDLDQILDGASRLWALTNTYCSVISQAYDETSTDRGRRSERERLHLLDALLDGRLEDLPSPAETARLLGFGEDQAVVVVVADVPEAQATSREATSRLEQALRLAGHRSTWRVRDQRQIGVVMVDERATLAGLGTVLAERAAGRIGVSPRCPSLIDAWTHVGLAELAAACLPPGAVGVAFFDDHPINLLVARSPELSERVAQVVLGPVLALDPDERDTLLDTLRAWAREGGSTPRTATRLFCHRNTVRNRLARVEALTGRSLADPLDVTAVCTAVAAVDLAG